MYIVSVLLGEQLSQPSGPCHAGRQAASAAPQLGCAELCEQERLMSLSSSLKFLSQLLLAHYYVARESSPWL